MYQNYLNTENAQRIADEIMKIVPYDINIADTEGVIIASGDRNKVGSLHKGALEALEKKKSHIVYKGVDTEEQGISLPILYNNTMAGVICIRGEADEVMTAGQICMSMTTLMLENQLLSEMSAIKASRLKDFLFEWISKKETEYDDVFYDQAAYFNVDLTLPRTAVIITSDKLRYGVAENIKKHLSGSEYMIRQGAKEVLILFRTEKRLRARLEKIMKISGDLHHCYIGESDQVAERAVNSAMQVSNIAKMIQNGQRFLCYEEVSLECLVSEVTLTKQIEDIIHLLQEKDVDGVLRDTIIAYVKDNDNHAAICEKLHVHRNTLNYRLGRIEEVFHCNPRKMKDLMMLYISAIKMGETKG